MKRYGVFLTIKNCANERTRRQLNDSCLRDVQCRAEIMSEDPLDRPAPQQGKYEEEEKEWEIEA